MEIQCDYEVLTCKQVKLTFEKYGNVYSCLTLRLVFYFVFSRVSGLFSP